MNYYGQTLREFQDYTICVANVPLATVGQLVRVVGGVTLEGQRVSEVTPALASSVNIGKSVIGIFRGAVNGSSPAAAGTPIKVQWAGSFTAAGAGGSAGDPLFVDDLGFPGHLPGTFRRIVGTIHGNAMGLMWGDFNGRTERLFDDALSLEEDLGTTGTARNVRFRYGVRASMVDLPIAGGTSEPISCDAMTYLVTCSGGAGAITVQLPLDPIDGTVVTIKDANGGAAVHNLVIDPNADTIDGAATLTLSVAWSSVTLQYVRSKWYIVAKVG